MKSEIQHNATAACRVRLVRLVLALLILVGGSYSIRAQAPTPTPLWTPAGTSDITNTNAGNVGIGTPTPTSKLDVVGTAAVSGDLKAAAGRVKLSFSGPEGLIQGAIERLSFSTTNGSGGQAVRLRFGGNAATSTAEFLNVSSVLFPADVRFAVGTTAPEGTLDVRGGVALSGAGLPLILSAQQGSSSGGAGGNVIINSGPNGGSSPNGSIIFGAGGSITSGVLTSGERMRITDSGYVGIGTNVPLQRFQIGSNSPVSTTTPDAISLGATYSAAAGANPKLRLWDQGAGIAYGLGVSAGQFDFIVPTGARYVWSVNGLEKMRLDTAGNLGVGNATPGFKLDVAGSINGSGLCIAGVCKSSWSDIGGSSQWSGTGNIFYNTGNVGIGTSSPTTAKLVISGTPGADGLDLSSTDQYANLRVIRNSNGSLDKDLHLQWGAGLGSKIHFYSNNAESMTLAGGNVGIGIASPGEKLSVNGTININRSGAPAAAEFRLYNGGSVAEWAFRQASGVSHNLNISKAVSGVYTDFLTVNTAGNVGIGTNSPAFKLDVNGTAHISGDVTVDGNLSAKYQDVAEWVPSTNKLLAGTVVVLNPNQSNQVMPSVTAYDTRVAGVVSEQPGLTLGVAGADKSLIATTGRVKIKVDATRSPINVGDLLVTSDIGGFAMKSVEVDIGGVKIHRPGTIIGKALEPLATGKGEILALLSLQ